MRAQCPVEENVPAVKVLACSLLLSFSFFCFCLLFVRQCIGVRCQSVQVASKLL